MLLGSAVPAGQSGSVTSTASRATTADATLASYGGSALNGLTLSGGNVLFNGTTTSATYTLSGTVSGTAGSAVGGTFGLNATDEFSNVLTNAAGVTFSGTAVNERTFSSPAQHDFGRVLLGTALSSGNLGITTGGSNATTADATLAAYGGSAVNGLTATGAATLADGTVPTINRVISGTLSGTAGTLTGTFQMGATDEFSNVTANAANVSYTVSGLATRTVTAPASTALGTYHAGAPVNVTSNPFGFSYGSGGTGDHADTEDTTVQTYTGGADANGITLTGAANNITTGVAFTRSFTGTAAVNSSGGSFNPAVNPEFSAATTVTAAYTIGVYSGNMKWSGISGGNWNNDSNWTDSVAGGIQAAPGRDVSYLNTDGANFGATSGAVTVHLNVSSSLKTVAFDGTGTYTVDSTVGTLTLKSGSGDASISVTGSGTQTISAPIVLANVGNTQVSVAANGTLNLGAISDTATTTLVKTGAGVLNLDGALTIDTLKTTGGVTNLNSAFTGGILNANATTNITVSEDLLELNIGTVPLAPVANFGGDSGTATSTVPEPGALGMLLVGGLGILGTRRRR